MSTAFVRLTDPNDGTPFYVRTDLIAAIFEVPEKPAFTKPRHAMPGQPPLTITDPGKSRHAIIRSTSGDSYRAMETVEGIFAQLTDAAEMTLGEWPSSEDAIRRRVEAGE